MNKNTMKLQALSLPDLFDEVFWRLESDVRLVLPTKSIFNINNIYIVGSGDSYMSGKATEQSFMELTHSNTRAFQSLEFSRYFLELGLPKPEKNNLVIAISNSGSAARVIEAQTKATKRNCETLALTSNLDGGIGEVSKYTINCEHEKIGSGPGVRSFMTMQLALQLLSIRIGEVRANYTMDKAREMREGLFALKDIISEALEDKDSKIQEFAKIVNSKEDLEVIASGSMKGIGEFTVASVVEAVGYNSVYTDIEEFGHVNFFKNNPENIPTLILVTGDSRAQSRAKEIIESVASLGRPYLIVTDGEGINDNKHSNNTLVIPGAFDEKVAPIVYSAVASFLVSLFGNQEDPDYFRGHKGVYDESKIVRPNESKIEL